MPHQHDAKVIDFDAARSKRSADFHEEGSPVEPEPVGTAVAERDPAPSLPERESADDSDIDTILDAFERKARFLASEIDVARMNGAMTERQRNSLKKRLEVSIAYVNGSVDDCYERKEIGEEELKKRLETSWGEVASYLKEVEDLKEKKRAGKERSGKSSRTAGKKNEPTQATDDRSGETPTGAGAPDASSLAVVSEPAPSETDPDDFSDEALLARGVDVSGLSNMYDMPRGKKRRISKDIVRTATAAAKAEPIFIGKKDLPVADADRPEKAPEEDSLYGEEVFERAIAEAGTLNDFYFALRNFSGEIPQDDNGNNRFGGERLAEFLLESESRLLDLSDDDFAKTDLWKHVPSKHGIAGKFRELVSAERQSYSKTEMYRGGSVAESRRIPAGENADVPEPEPAPEEGDGMLSVMRFRRSPEMPDRRQLEEELKRVLTQLSEKSEQSAKAEQERINAEEYWKEAVDIREREEKNPGGMLGMFLSDGYKEETLRNLREEEAEDERRYRKVASRAEELKREMDALKSRRDEIEHDIENLPPDGDGAAIASPAIAESVKTGAVIAKESEPKPKEQKPIPGSVLSKFESMGIELDHLNGIEGFADLSEGQQLLVFENLQQLSVGRIQEEAEERAEKDRRESGWAGRLWKSVSKRYQIAKAEKTATADIMTGGVAVHGETLRQLVIGMRNQGPEVKIGEDGETLEIQFASGFEDLSDKDRETVDAFNAVANAFARMPYEWSLGTATADERERYAAAKERHDVLREKLLGVIRNRSESIPAGMLAMNGIDDRVRMMQFLQSTPDLEKRLDDLEDQGAWKTMLSSVVTERGLYMASGYAGRTLLAGALGWVAAPAVASIMGGIAARKRAGQELREREIAARKGRKDTSAEKKNFVPVKGLSEKLENLLNKVMESSGEKGQMKAALSLKARIDYTRMKLEEGLVDFGSEAEDRVWEQYDLFDLLSQAEAAAGIYSGENGELKDRLAAFLEFKDAKIKAAEKRYIRNQTMKGAAYAAGFALAGAGIRHLSELIADRMTVPAGEPETLKDVLGEEKIPQAPAPPEAPVVPAESTEAPNPPFAEPEKNIAPEKDGADPWRDESEAVPKSSSASAETQAEQIARQDAFAETARPEPGVGAEALHGDVRSAVEGVDEYNKGMAEEELAALKAGQVATGEAGSGISPEIAEQWNEAAGKASLGEGPRPQVALSNEVAPDYSEMSAPAEPEPVRNDAAMEELVEKLSKPEAPQIPDVPAETGGVPEMRAAPILPAEEVTVSAENSVAEGAENPTTPLDATPAPADTSGTTGAAVESASAHAPAEAPKVVLGDTKTFVAEHPDMLESLKREVGGYRVGIFQTTETEGDIAHDYIHSGLGKTGMADALESHEYGKPSDLHASQLANLSEFRKAAEKAFVAKLGEYEGKGTAMVAAGETIDEYTRRMATIALQLGVKIRGF